MCVFARDHECKCMGGQSGRGQYHHSSGTATQTRISSRVIERENRAEREKSKREKRKRAEGLEEELLWDTLSHCEMMDLEHITGLDMNVSWKRFLLQWMCG